MELNKIEKSIAASRFLVGGVFVLVVASYVVWFLIMKDQPLSGSTQDWGAFGDFVGGLLNPLIAFSAFYWLTVSVRVQKEELEETKNALLDSAAEQKKLAQATENSIRIEVINMRLDQVKVRLEDELQYRQSALTKEYEIGRRKTVMTNDGEEKSLGEALKLSTEIIKGLSLRQADLIAEADMIIESPLP